MGTEYFYILLGVFLAVIGIALFLVKAVSLYEMSKGMRIKNSYLSFIPFCASLIFGKIAEKGVKKKGLKPTKFSLILFVLKILQYASFGILVCFVIASVNKIYDFAYDAVLNETVMTVEMFSSIIPVVICFCVCFAISIAHVIIYYVAFFRICKIFDKQNATAFTVVSIFLPVLLFIFLFIMSKKEPITE